jgi:hypothetical protein
MLNAYHEIIAAALINIDIKGAINSAHRSGAVRRVNNAMGSLHC